jgi:hypothetical protein
VLAMGGFEVKLRFLGMEEDEDEEDREVDAGVGSGRPSNGCCWWWR